MIRIIKVVAKTTLKPNVIIEKEQLEAYRSSLRKQFNTLNVVIDYEEYNKQDASGPAQDSSMANRDCQSENDADAGHKECKLSESSKEVTKPA